VDRLAPLRLQEIVSKAENLKTVGITDDPKIQLVPLPVGGRNLDKARETSLLFDGPIDGREGRPRPFVNVSVPLRATAGITAA
jgi:hypothetical protein